MKPLSWDKEKNEWLLENRGVCFEMVEDEIVADRYRIVTNRSREHKDQKVLIVGFADLMPPGRTIIHVVPFIEYIDRIELKTIFPDLYWQMRYGASL